MKSRLQRRAKRHGRSVEEEVREILRDATKREAGGNNRLGTAISLLFRQDGLRAGEEIAEIGDIEIRAMDVEE
ncbi:MAG TPA: hypothetical protein VJN93_09510 [Candidatus Acidoferrum sp.]|nr:hypothetical protein [Candidatus Acidoferrum sp.]